MSALSTATANALAYHWFGRITQPAPMSYHLALFTAAPNAGGGGTEVSAATYSRLQINNTNTIPFMWNKPGDGTAKNAFPLTFPAALESWGTITHWALFDSSTGGTMHFFGPLAQSKAIASGDQFSVATGDLEFTFL
jgi:hypothetical protein